VREKRGLCYSIYTFHAPYTDTGFFGLYTGTDPADAPEMMEGSSMSSMTPWRP
jgi:predicted Zn-dependent peptidase